MTDNSSRVSCIKGRRYQQSELNIKLVDFAVLKVKNGGGEGGGMATLHLDPCMLSYLNISLFVLVIHNTKALGKVLMNH